MLYLFMLLYTFVVYGKKYTPVHKHVHTWSPWKKHSVRKRTELNPSGLDFNFVERVEVRTCSACEHEDRRSVELYRSRGCAREAEWREAFNVELELFNSTKQAEIDECIAVLKDSALRYDEVIDAMKVIGFNTDDADMVHKTVLSLITGARV